jgi:hypothetical protein
MTDMKPRQITVFGPRFMLAMLLAAFATFAQESNDVDALEPAVDTSELAPAVDTSAPEPAVDTSAAVTDEGAEAEPAGEAAALANDVTRQQSGGQVMDRLELGTTEVTGNSELPTVLYIVPWQKSDPGNLTGKPVNTLLQEVLEPLDREEFLRRVDYHGELNGAEETAEAEE